MNPIESIRACQYLYLHAISEPEENTLRVVLLEAKVGNPPSQQRLAAEKNLKLRAMLEKTNEIIHGEECQIFELNWPSYIGYSVENESYSLPEPKESVGEGRLMVEYTESVYLNYLSKTTFASPDYPGRFKHWSLYCLNHTINVASVNAPLITISSHLTLHRSRPPTAAAEFRR
jgi:hypothetical protein